MPNAFDDYLRQINERRAAQRLGNAARIIRGQPIEEVVVFPEEGHKEDAVSAMKDTKNVKPFDIDQILGTPKNRVDRIGVELEGAWTKIPEGAVFEHDGSVFRGNPPPGMRTGEIPFGPTVPGRLSVLMKRFFPDKVDFTCGMHVHMGFENLHHYQLLMVPEYQATVVEYLKRWAKKEGFAAGHHIWERLSGKSPFCQDKYWPDAQVKAVKDHDQNRQGHRYTIVNYCHKSHKTVEVRVLPMMTTVEQSIRAVRYLIDVTNACLVKRGVERDQKLVREELRLDADGYEEFIEEAI